jgi:hypothetical protein
VSSLGSFNYRVERLGVAAAGADDPAAPVDSPELTLVTSNSGTVPSGLEYVVARLVGKPLAYVSRGAIVVPPGAIGLGGDWGFLLPSLGWFVALVLAAVATVVGYRRLREPLALYILSAPVLLAVCVLLFQNMAGLLPATL